MIINVKNILLFVCLPIFFLPAAAQNSNARQNEEINRQNRERNINESMLATDALMRGPRLPRSRPAAKPLSKEERAKIKVILDPNAEDYEKYKEFLGQKKTGIFRLFSDFDCEANNTVRVDGSCAGLVPGSWNYSFRRKDYTDADLLDIKLKDGNLISKGFLNQGIIVDLGDTPLDNVSMTSAGVKFLSDFVPEKKIADVKKQFDQISKGIDADGFRYAKVIKAAENTTYALRVVAYRNEFKTLSRLSPTTDAQDLRFYYADGDKRIDMIVAFRIIRSEKNGSVTILWKELDRHDAPKLSFEQKGNLSDIK